MGQIPKNHNELYFDTLCRTQKGESVLSLIQATYHAKNSGIEAKDMKAEIAKRLEYAYNLFKDNSKGKDTGAGSYNGNVDQFSSQYTIGHEMGIWMDSSLELNKLAKKVAENIITVRDYFDVVFLNYFQPVNNKPLHLLYHLLEDMHRNKLTSVDKKQMGEIYKNVVNSEYEGEVNGAFNMLISSNYFENIGGKTLKYIGKYSIPDLITFCNKIYLENGYEVALEELNSDEKYAEYLTSDPRNMLGASEEKIAQNSRVTGGENVLLYGVPGSGKSYTIKKKYCSDKKLMERVVFHPDYTYSDFVGQILPRVIKDEGNTEGRLRYIFSSGPFTNMLKKAEDNPGNMYFLVIEEINRGNAPAIFGEIFQLLDRDEHGTSEYGITNYDVALEVYKDAEHEIKLPSNLTILATMNTSDQNVFTLDTAFQRRWDMKMIENNIDKAVHADKKILDTDITWRSFNETINKAVIENSMGAASSEDKRLGTYFVKASDIIYNCNENSINIDEKDKAFKENGRFPEKVLKYLWDDVFKYNREDIFDEKYKSLEEVVFDFKHGKRFDVFKLKFYEDELVNIKKISEPDDQQ